MLACATGQLAKLGLGPVITATANQKRRQKQQKTKTPTPPLRVSTRNRGVAAAKGSKVHKADGRSVHLTEDGDDEEAYYRSRT
eukprot:gene18724-26428_t